MFRLWFPKQFLVLVLRGIRYTYIGGRGWRFGGLGRWNIEYLIQISANEHIWLVRGLSMKARTNELFVQEIFSQQSTGDHLPTGTVVMTELGLAHELKPLCIFFARAQLNISLVSASAHLHSCATCRTIVLGPSNWRRPISRYLLRISSTE